MVFSNVYCSQSFFLWFINYSDHSKNIPCFVVFLVLPTEFLKKLSNMV